MIVKDRGEVKVIPRQPQITIQYIKWPSFSFPSIEWHFPKLPDKVFDGLCLLDEIGKDCVNSRELTPGGNSGSGSFTFESPEDSNVLVSMLPGDQSIQGHQGCTCQKRCICTGGGPYKKRQKRAIADSYKEFLDLTKDCVSERACRRAYTKFLKHGA